MIRPDEFHARYGVTPPEELVQVVVDDLDGYLVSVQDQPEESMYDWIRHDFIVKERVQTKLRVWMIELGYFPGTATQEFFEDLADYVRSRMFRTPHFWRPINEQAANTTDFNKQ